MLDYTTLQVKRQKRKYAINLTNSLLFEMSPKLLPVSYNISYFMPLKGFLQVLPIKLIPSFLEGEATRTSI